MYLGDQLSYVEISIIGLAIVFVGLVCLILICSVMGSFFAAKKSQPKKETAPVQLPQQNELNIPNRQEFIAAVSAVIAEEMGTDISGIRIVSIKKV